MMPRLALFARRLSARFYRDESGTVIVFALTLFFLMALFGGVALDVMKYEAKRTALANAIDRSTLAAASLSNALDPESVVRDYFAKAGLEGELRDVTVTGGVNGRTVRARGVVDTKPLFLHLVGIEDFDARAVAQAEQRINNIEIVLVLDVSGSMSGAKITNLRAAASEFVQTVLANDSQHRISVSIVPYNAQVNLGPTLRGKYNATNLHGVSGVDCLELPSSTYASAGISRTTALPMAAFADVTSSTSQSTAYVAWSNTSSARMSTSAPFCRNTAANVVRLPNNNIATLQSQINALTAGGNTSITLGMKWGVAMLDPSARTMYSELIASGAIPPAMAGRPFAYDDDEAMKIIVLMTDGEHVSHTRINDAYKTGTSPIWRSTGDGNYSIQFTTGRPVAAGTNTYWVPHLCVSTSCQSGTNTAEAWRATAWNSGSGVTQQTWQNVWANQRLTWVAWQLYARALGTNATSRNTQYTTAMNALSSTYASVSAMDASLQTSCTQAKANGVLVFGIAFEAPANGQAQISACASSPAHYFDAQGLEIQTAFRTIATSITQLRLTQ